MTTRTRSGLFASPLAAALVVGSAIVGGAVVYSTAESARVPAAAPSSVALVDYVRVINSLKEREDREAMNNVRINELRANLKNIMEEIERLTNDLNTKIPATDYAARAQAIGALEELQAVAKTRKEVYQVQASMINGESISLLYNKVLAATDAFAKREGYDLVLMDDRGIVMPPQGSAGLEQVNNLARTRHVLWAREGLDVTDRLISWMNTAYAAGGGVKAPETAPGSGGGTTGVPR